MRVVLAKNTHRDRAPARGEERQEFDHYLIPIFWHMEVNVWSRFGNFALTQRRERSCAKPTFVDRYRLNRLVRARTRARNSLASNGFVMKSSAPRSNNETLSATSVVEPNTKIGTSFDSLLSCRQRSSSGSPGKPMSRTTRAGFIVRNASITATGGYVAAATSYPAGAKISSSACSDLKSL